VAFDLEHCEGLELLSKSVSCCYSFFCCFLPWVNTVKVVGRGRRRIGEEGAQSGLKAR